jgi:hypothetical protein
MTENPRPSTAPDPGTQASAGSVAPRPGLPTRIDVKRAFDVYVYGRDRTLAPSQKGAAIEGRPSAPRFETEGAEQEERSMPPARVTVPRELRFDRSAGTWRDRLAGQDGGKP